MLTDADSSAPAAVAPPPVLALRGLSKTFPGTIALDRVDFDVRPGEVHALIGQNGCGKSTLIKVLAGYHQPDPGTEIRLAGEPGAGARLGGGAGGAAGPDRGTQRRPALRAPGPRPGRDAHRGREPDARARA